MSRVPRHRGWLFDFKLRRYPHAGTLDTGGSGGTSCTRLRRGIAGFLTSVLLCGCSTAPLVGPALPFPTELPDEDTYEVALQEASGLIAAYRKRVNAASRWLLGHHILEAVVGGTALTSVVGAFAGETEGNLTKVAGVAALAGVIVGVIKDEGDMKSQREGYARGIAVIECTISVTRQKPRYFLTQELDRIRGEILVRALRAVQASVTASVTATSMGQTRTANPASGEESEGTGKTPQPTPREFWTEETNHCLSMLVPDDIRLSVLIQG